MVFLGVFMKKILTLIFMIMLLCGCSKYEGTWCQKSEVFSTLVILEDNYTTKEYNNILDKVENLNYLRGFDIVDDIEKGNTGNVPDHIKTSSTTYKYPHDYPNAFVKQEYLPKKLKGKHYYHPKDIGYEKNIKSYYEFLEKLKRES